VGLGELSALVRARRTSLVLDPDRPVPGELVERLVELVTWAPNHKRTWPWRLAVVTGEGRGSLGDAFALDQVRAGRPPDDPKVLKTRGKYRRAPVVVVVGSAPHESSDLAAENSFAVAAGIENLLLGATAAGLASFWSSPPVRDCPAARRLCGFDPGTEVVGVIYLGWPTGEAPTPERPPVVVTRVDG
jgi:nitroreductase